MILIPVPERPIVAAFRRELAVLGDQFAGDKFFDCCVYQQPFILPDGSCTTQIAGVTAHQWRESARLTHPPNSLTHWIRQRIIATADFAYRLDEVMVAIHLDEYGANASKEAFTYNRLVDRAIIAAGGVSLRFTEEEVNRSAHQCVQDSLLMLEKIMDRRETYAELPTRQFHFNLTVRESHDAEEAILL